MGLKPLEKRRSRNKIKIIALVIIILFGLLISKLPRREEENNVLGKSSFNLEKEKKKIIDNFSKKKEDVIGQTLGLSTNFINDLGSRSTKIVADYIYDNGLKNLIKQINRLPKEQQEKIKESICK